MYSFVCEFYLGDRTLLETKECSFSDWEIGMFGNLYGENLLLSLGNHYKLYEQRDKNYSIKNLYKTSPVGKFDILHNKKRSPAVTGNIGEAIAMPALTSCLKEPINKLPFQRFHSNSKCPDYRIQTKPEILRKLWGNKYSSLFSNFPRDFPMEVKTHLGKDQKYPIGALNQLKSYWLECETLFPEAIGYGLIARVNLANNTIRYFLLAPKNPTNKRNILVKSITEIYDDLGEDFLR